MGIKAAILGVSGYTGQQLLSILSNHSEVEIKAIFGKKSIGKTIRDIASKDSNLSELKVQNYINYNFKDIDIVFSCLPHNTLQKIIKKINAKKLIDLSADFRFQSAKKYKEFYNYQHTNPQMLKKFTYGLSEINKTKIKNSNFVANPGCYPTSVLIPLIPILKNIKNKSSIIIDAKSGLSGAGKILNDSNLFVETNENIRPYKVFTHRHYPEIMEKIEENNIDCELTFTPHLIPISRGILSTIYLKNININSKRIRDILKKKYHEDYFVEILSEGVMPSLKSIIGTNKISLNIFEDTTSKTIVIISAIDNLIKGAAGQAVQNMNLMYNLNVTESLKVISMVP